MAGYDEVYEKQMNLEDENVEERAENEQIRNELRFYPIDIIKPGYKDNKQNTKIQNKILISIPNAIV